MKHELTLSPGGGEHIHQDFGLLDDSYERMIDHISVELFQNMMFRGDKRSKTQCLLDVLNELEPEDFGVKPTTANHYFMIGIAFAKAIEIVDTAQDALMHKSMESLPGLMQHLMARSKEKEAIRHTSGSVN